MFERNNSGMQERDPNVIDSTAEQTWYLVQYKPNSHLIAERNLRRQAFTTFLPMQTVNCRQRGRFTTRKRPLFPGYLFVAHDPRHARWRAINATLGVSRLVALSGEPTPVPTDLVRQLMDRFGDPAEPTSTRGFKPGENVMMTTGPFLEFAATIEDVAPDQRVVVLFDFMGRKARVAVRSADLCHIVDRKSALGATTSSCAGGLLR